MGAYLWPGFGVVYAMSIREALVPEEGFPGNFLWVAPKFLRIRVIQGWRACENRYFGCLDKWDGTKWEGIETTGRGTFDETVGELDRYLSRLFSPRLPALERLGEEDDIFP